ncbi:MAG: sulfate adenylyltransferase [Candidatus Cloacimonadota bacterium]|nr:MAG: sulfate adenylyltransferase [Candidatus Cloacimonadota bacterium]
MLSKPHGNKLVRRVLLGDKKKEIVEKSGEYTKIILEKELLKDAQNIARGIFSPLEGFMSKLEIETVVDEMHLPSGIEWTIPIMLDVSKEQADKIEGGESVLLLDEGENTIAILFIEDKFQFDKKKIAENIYGTLDENHPGVNEMLGKKEYFLGGKIDLIDDSREPFPEFNLDPRETRVLFREKGWNTVVAFQTRNPIHRAHEYIQRCALEVVDGLFINPLMGRKKKGDFRDDIILESYKKIMSDFYPKDRVVMSILPTRMHYAGPKEAIHHAIMRKNFGCTHIVIGRDHAGVGKYYGTFDAQKMFDNFPDLGIQPLKFEHSFYCKKCGAIATVKTCGHSSDDRVPPSGTVIRELISKKELPPKEIMREEISKVLISFDKPFVE